MASRITFLIEFRNEELAIESAFALTDALAVNDEIASCQIIYEAIPGSKRVHMSGCIETYAGGEVLEDVAADIGATCILVPGFFSGSINVVEAEAI